MYFYFLIFSEVSHFICIFCLPNLLFVCQFSTDARALTHSHTQSHTRLQTRSLPAVGEQRFNRYAWTLLLRVLPTTVSLTLWIQSVLRMPRRQGRRTHTDARAEPNKQADIRSYKCGATFLHNLLRELAYNWLATCCGSNIFIATSWQRERERVRKEKQRNAASAYSLILFDNCQRVWLSNLPAALLLLFCTYCLRVLFRLAAANKFLTACWYDEWPVNHYRGHGQGHGQWAVGSGQCGCKCVRRAYVCMLVRACCLCVRACLYILICVCIFCLCACVLSLCLYFC